MKIFTWKQRMWVFTINLGMITLFGLVGYWIDLLTQKKPLFLALGVLLSFPLGQWLLIKRLKKDQEQA